MISLRPRDTVCDPTELKVANSWEMVRLKLPSSGCRTDVQQIRVIAVVMITVLPEPAKIGSTA